MKSSIQTMTIPKGKKVYFASDFHFGIPDFKTSLEREKLVCQWLDAIKHDAQHIFLLGDLFDSWIEYRKAVPRGYIRFLGKLAELTDNGIGITVFTGNHDLWMTNYFEEQLNIKVYKQVQTFQINDKLFHIGHGDGVSKLEKKYKAVKYILHHPFCQWLYKGLHPNFGLWLADYFSRLGPKHKYEDLQMKADEEEYQIDYAKSVLETETIDFFIFGHRHIPIVRKLNNNSVFINLGDWLVFNTYAFFDGENVRLEKY